MAGDLGTIKGQMILDVRQALAAYTAARLAHLSTVTALATGGAAMAAAGTVVAGAGIAMAAGIGYAVKTAADFEKRLDYFGAVSASTQKEYDAVRKKAIQLGQDTIYSANDIADSFVELGKAGISAKQIIGGVGEGVAALGAAADIPLDTAAQIITSAVQTFQLGADQAVHVADRLAGAANASIVDVQDLGVSLKYAGGVAKALGGDFDETITALGLLGKFGIKGSTAGTSLRQTLLSLSGTTKQARNALFDLGIMTEDGKNKFFDAQGSAKDLSEVFQILQDATKGLSDEEKVATFKQIFQTRALPTVIALTKAGARGFKEMNAEISKTTAIEVSTKRLDNLSGDIEILRGNIETLAIEVGSSFQEIARSIVQALTKAVQWFTNLDKGTQLTIIKIVAITAAVLTFVGALGIFAGIALNLIALFIKLKDAFILIQGAIRAVAVATWAMNSAFLANPITWIILAVVALIAVFVLLWKNNEGFRNFFINAWKNIKTAFSAVLEWFKTLPKTFSDIWTKVKDAVVNGISTAIEWLKTNWPLVLAIITGPIGLLVYWLQQNWENIKQGVVTAWTAILDFFKAVPGQVGSFLSSLPSTIGYWIGFALGYALRIYINAWKLIINAVSTGITAVVDFFRKLPGRVNTFITNLVNTSIALFKKLTTLAIQQATNLYNGVVNFFQKLPGRAATFFTNTYNNVVSWLGKMVTKGAELGNKLVTNIVNFVQELPGKVLKFFRTMYENVSTWLGKAVDKAGELGGKIASGIISGIEDLPGKVTGILSRVIDAIKGQITKAFDAVKDFASSMWEGFKDGLGINSPSLIEKQMVQITEVTDEETGKLKKQVQTLQSLGSKAGSIGDDIASSWSGSLAGGLNSLKEQMVTAQTYQKSLLNIAATTGSTPSGTGILAASSPTIIVQEGDKVTLDVDWHAAPDSSVTTQQQLMSMLGRSSVLLKTEGVTNG